MASNIKVKVSLGNTPIVGQPAHYVVTVTNSGTTAASVTGIQLACIPSSAANVLGPVNMPVGGTVLVSETSGTTYFSGGIIFNAQALDGMAASGSPGVELYAVVSCDDGTVTPSTMLPVMPNRALVNAPVNGGLRLDWGGLNSYALQMVPETAS